MGLVPSKKTPFKGSTEHYRTLKWIRTSGLQGVFINRSLLPMCFACTGGGKLPDTIRRHCTTFLPNVDMTFTELVGLLCVLTWDLWLLLPWTTPSFSGCKNSLWYPEYWSMLSLLLHWTWWWEEEKKISILLGTSPMARSIPSIERLHWGNGALFLMEEIKTGRTSWLWVVRAGRFL